MRLRVKTAITAMMGLLALANGAFGQSQTISARPGLVNYVEGEATLNGKPVDASLKNPLFVQANDIFSTGRSKAEILLMPGVFLRVGSDSQVTMLAPSLEDTRFSLLQGEVIVEAVGLVRGSQVSVEAAGATITIGTSGLYRIRAGSASSAATYVGTMDVTLGGQTLKLRKEHESVLGTPLRSEKMDLDEGDELYAWSSVRSQYEAAASYQAGLSAAGSANAQQPGWYFYDLLDTWAWLPQSAFFSSFGWGFYPTGSVGRAPVVVCTVLRGGHWGDRPRPISGGLPTSPAKWVGLGSARPVPIDPKHPPVTNFVAGTPRVERFIRSDQEASLGTSSRGLRSVTNRMSSNRLTASRPVVIHNQVRVTGGGLSRSASSGGGRASSSSSGSRSSSSSGSSSRGGSSGGGGSHASSGTAHR